MGLEDILARLMNSQHDFEFVSADIFEWVECQIIQLLVEYALEKNQPARADISQMKLELVRVNKVQNSDYFSLDLDQQTADARVVILEQQVSFKVSHCSTSQLEAAKLSGWSEGREIRTRSITGLVAGLG